jgi:modification methylase
MQTDHRIIFGSAVDLPAIADDSVELVVTSPPYPMIEMWDAGFVAQDPGIGERLAAADGPGGWARMHALLDAVWDECARVLRPGGFLCINIGDATRTIGGDFRLYTNHSRITAAMEARGMHSLPPIIWRKPANGPNKFMGSGTLPAGAYVTLEHEYVLIFRAGGKRTFSPAEMDRRRRSACFWEERNEWYSDLWEVRGVRQRMDAAGAGAAGAGAGATGAGDGGAGAGTPGEGTTGDGGAPGLAVRRDRSGAFPFEVAFRLISMYSSQEDTVLDPFLGTGTTTLAAMAAGRSSIGVEIDETLTEAIEATLTAAPAVSREQQAARFAAHLAFLVERHAAGGTSPAHRNVPHDVPVVMRQERELTLPVVTGIERVSRGHYRADHEVYDPGPERYVQGTLL